ncbi:MAG: 30S ribosomal protein S1 [Actinomycetia bacterium]|nr:30S ribosomal protein S1 [Actinomycetes bacterium]
MAEQEFGTTFEHPEMSQDAMEELIDGTLADFDEGDLVQGTVVKIEHDEVLLDIGYKSEGVIPARELSIRKDASPADLVSIGDEVEALVLQKEDKEGRLILSKKRAEYERAWKNVEEQFENQEVVEGEVIETVKGGLIVDIGLRGFLPASLIDLRRVRDLDSFMGERLEARIIEMDRNRNNVVLSRRVLLEEDRKQDRGELLGKLQKGMILPGVVSSIVEFGAFIDLGGIDGLVHISELSWSHVNHPSEVVKVGDEVEVQVLEVELERERISLGLKQTSEDPWKKMVEGYPVDAILEGTVTKLVPFGVFIELGEGVEGLVHISEMAKGHVETPQQVVEVGDKVQVKVMGVNAEKRRISLSMRAAAEDLGYEIEIRGKAKDEEAEGADDAGVEAPVEQLDIEDMPADDSVVEEAPVTEEAVVEEAPVTEEAVVEEAPVADEAVVEEAPVAEEAAVEATVADDAPVPLDESLVVEDQPADEVVVAEPVEAVEEAPVEEVEVDPYEDVKLPVDAADMPVEEV